jgi:hypothetical protein
MPTPYSNMVDAAGDAVRKILAYHGSPHSFDKFDATKSGTGSGGSVYGSGLYFSEAEDTAKHYRDKLSTSSYSHYLDGKPVSWDEMSGHVSEPVGTEQGLLARLLRTAHANKLPLSDATEHARHWLDRWHRTGTPRGIPPEYQHYIPQDWRDQQGLEASVEKVRDMLSQLGPQGSRVISKPNITGKMYEVSIDQDPAKFMDWDEQLRHQPVALESMQRAIGQIPASHDRNNLIDALPHMQGKDGYWDAARIISDHLGGTTYARSHLSKMLSEEGLPGIRYDDQMNALGATSNYVMFPGTEDSISILRKYGLLPAVGAGAAAMSQNPAQTSE